MEENKIDIQKLNEMYHEAETCDRDVFSEMRSNILLMAGKHYNKVQRGLERNLRSAGAPKQVRLRLVKNHLQKAISDGRDLLASLTPGYMPYPAKEAEASSQKAAKLAKAVLETIRRQNDAPDWEARSRQAFTDIGEACAKVFYDPFGGGIKGYEQKLSKSGHPLILIDGEEMEHPIDEMTGQLMEVNPMTGEAFELAPDKEKPQWRGKITLKKIEGYKLRRPKSSTSIKTAPWLLYTDMADAEELKAQIKKREDITNEQKEKILEGLETTAGESFKVFDGTTGSYQESEGQIEIREYYFRQCVKYPEGYFMIATDRDILWEGPLPFGEHGEIAFPIKWAPNITFEASARGFSLIKHLRPIQAEINRLASARAETSITLGPDKVLLHQGSKFSRGMEFGGIRQMFFSGEKPTIIPGRDGSQYVESLNSEIGEIYALAKVPENANTLSQAFDPKAEIFKSQKQKARFSESAQRLSRFFKDCYETSLFLAQNYLDEEDLIDYVGMMEISDIAEFKTISRHEFTLKLEEVSDDIDSMLGKQIELETILQYRGKDLDDVTASQLLKQFPMLNKTKAFAHLTLDLENIESDLLAMDRGEYIPARKNDNHEMCITHLTHRVKQRDFRYLPEEVQAMYEQKITEHEQVMAEMIKAAQMIEQGAIPADGPLVKVDFYINPDPENPAKTERATVPSNAIQWLLDKLQEQGMAQDRLGEMDLVNQAQIAQQMQQMPQQEQMPQEDPMQQMMMNQGGF